MRQKQDGPPAGKQNKIQTLSTQLRELAYKKGPAARMPTVREICHSFGVSKGTVEDALGALEAENVIFRKQGSGIYVASTLHQKTISILLNSSFFQTPGTSPFWGNLLFLLTEEAQRRAMQHEQAFRFYLTTALQSLDDPLHQTLVSQITAGQVHGAICIGASVEITNWIDQHLVPCVAFAGFATGAVTMDSNAVLRYGLETLVRQGCRRIGYLAAANPFQPIQFRTEGIEQVRQALADYALPLEVALVKDYNNPRADGKTRIELTHQQQGYQAGMELFGLPKAQWPDGLISADDMMTSGLLAALHKLRLRPGQDIPIVTHANVGSSVLFGEEENLTRIEWDPKDIMQNLFELLDRFMANPAHGAEVVTIAPVVRPAMGFGSGD